MPGIGDPDSAACSNNIGFSSDYELKSTVTSITQIDVSFIPSLTTFWVKFTLSNSEGSFWINERYGEVNAGAAPLTTKTFVFTEDKPLTGLFGYKNPQQISAFGPI